MDKKIFEWIKTLIITLIVFFVFKTYVAQAYYIPTPSMVPTLKINDRIMTSKLTYKFADIKRGDIVVFNPPLKSKYPYVKRVIGLPNETISINNSIVYINGKPLKEPYISELPINEFESYKIPANNIFLMGDNRNNSYDSRYWGAISINNIIGKAEFIYYPFDEIKMLD
jgi:signal peptidase I